MGNECGKNNAVELDQHEEVTSESQEGNDHISTAIQVTLFKADDKSARDRGSRHTTSTYQDLPVFSR